MRTETTEFKDTLPQIHKVDPLQPMCTQKFALRSSTIDELLHCKAGDALLIGHKEMVLKNEKAPFQYVSRKAKKKIILLSDSRIS